MDIRTLGVCSAVLDQSKRMYVVDKRIMLSGARTVSQSFIFYKFILNISTFYTAKQVGVELRDLKAVCKAESAPKQI
jgi:hypothetical protein